MPAPKSHLTPQQFTSFGALLRYLRERAEITQRELALQVGYHYSYMSRLERDERFPDAAMILARFVPALRLENDLAWATRLVELAAAGRGETLPATLTLAHPTAPSASEQVPFPQPIPHPPALPVPNLPTPLTPLLGRDTEIAILTQLLTRPDLRLLTLVGPPGIGKTRLALQTSVEIAPHFADGVTFVDLAPVKAPDLLLSTLTQALGLPDTIGSETALHKALQTRQQLVVLDNFEQIIAAAPVVSRLLRAAPSLKILVTSREILHLNGENEFPVPPLRIEEDLGAPAIRLFVQRAQAVQPTFYLTPENAPIIAELCTRLDGLPLAIELAAARIKLFTPETMLARLDKRLHWLTGGKRDDHAWRTLRGAIDWSYQLLSPAEKTLFVSLAVFAGGGTLSAVEAICAGDLDTLSVLAEKSLITLHPAPDAEHDLRFTWLESLREYALEALTRQPELYASLQRTHAEYFQTFITQTGEDFIRARSVPWLKMMDAEYENLRTALQWALETRAGHLALSLCVGVGDYWEIRGHFDEGRRWLGAALALADLTPSVLLGKALRNAGWMAMRQNDYPEALAFYRRSVEIWQSLDDESGKANALMDLGFLFANEFGRNVEGAPYFQQALAIYEKLGDLRGQANCYNQLGLDAYNLGDFLAAHQSFEKSLSMRRTLGDRVAMTGSLNNLGLTAYALGEYAAAREWHLQALALREELGFEGRLGQSQHNLALALLKLGDLEQAEAYARLALQTGVKLKLKMNIVEAVEGLGMIAACRRQVDRAARLFGAAESLRQQIGAVRDLVQVMDMAWTLSGIGDLALTEPWRVAWEAGTQLDLYEAAEAGLGA